MIKHVKQTGCVSNISAKDSLTSATQAFLFRCRVMTTQQRKKTRDIRWFFSFTFRVRNHHDENQDDPMAVYLASVVMLRTFPFGSRCILKFPFAVFA